MASSQEKPSQKGVTHKVWIRLEQELDKRIEGGRLSTLRDQYQSKHSTTVIGAETLLLD